MKPFILFVALLLSASTAYLRAQNPKCEFRGAWLHTIGQGQYARQTTEQNKQYLRDQLDKLQAAGVNAVLFQVRPAADALYASNYELWSKFLTKDGKAPVPYWDPLQFMINEAHARGMELHAWLNPYRVTTVKDEKLPAKHLYYREPFRFVKYKGDGKIYFDPGLPENREFIKKVVLDIVQNYDVDAIHFDDYFYPYPAGKIEFPDDKSYAKYGKGMDRGDWRRKNVDLLIEQLSQAIRAEKPWVRFGISPFGIWRNKRTDPRGSETTGLQCYDALYADALLWAEKGWIDYIVPQLYWELEHKAAGYIPLVGWWADAVDPKCQLYIGQSVDRIMDYPDIAPSKDPNQLDHKMRMQRDLPAIQGTVWWPGYSVTANNKGVADSLANKYQSTIALVPPYKLLSNERPLPVQKLKLKDGCLSWKSEKPEGKTSDHTKYVVYRFDTQAHRDYTDPRYIVAVTPSTTYEVKTPGIYAVTALDRVNNESDPSNEVIAK